MGLSVSTFIVISYPPKVFSVVPVVTCLLERRILLFVCSLLSMLLYLRIC